SEIGSAPPGSVGAALQRHPPKKIWRWHVLTGICYVHGYRYGAELGVSTGRFTAYLCDRIPDLRMIAVDTWRDRPDHEGEGAETYEGRAHEKHYRLFKEFCETNFPGRVEIKREDTQTAHELVKDGSLDFVFIDADHTYDGCLADIKAWTPKVRPGGLVSGHDYPWPSVRRAVDDTGPSMITSDGVWLRFLEAR